LSAEFAAMDAVLERTRRILEGEETPAVHTERPQSVIVGGLVVRDTEWDERGRIEQWQAVGREVEDMPPTLAAAVLWEAWETPGTIAEQALARPLGGRRLASVPA
jgi:hypothetical protein